MIDIHKFVNARDLVDTSLVDNELTSILNHRINRLKEKNNELKSDFDHLLNGIRTENTLCVVLKNINENTLDQLSSLIYKLELYYLKSASTEDRLISLNNLNEKLSSHAQNHLILCMKAEIYYQLALIHVIENRDSEAIDHFNNAINIFQTAGLNVALGYSYSTRAQIYRSQFDFEKSLKDLSKAEKLFLKHEIVSQYGRIKVLLGTINYYYGDLPSSEQYFLDAIDYSKKYSQPRREAEAVKGLGLIDMARGEIKSAHKFIQQSIEVAEKNNVADHAFLTLYYYNKGQVLFYEGKFQESIDNMNKSIEESKNPNASIFQVYPLFFQFLCYLMQKNSTAIEELLVQINQIRHKGGISKAEQKAIKSIRALYLKSKPRITDKISALIMFKELVKSHRSDFEFRLMQYLEICDILLDEFRLYKEQEVLNEISRFLDDIVEMKKHTSSMTTDIELQLLRAELIAINGEVDNAMKLLDNLKDFSSDKNLGYVLTKVKRKKEKIKSDFLDWQNIISANNKLKLQINNSKINDYITYTSKIMSSISKKSSKGHN